MAPATAKYHLWFRAECRGPSGEKRSFQTFLLGRELFMRLVYLGYTFLLRHLISSLHLAGEAVSDEVAGIENQIWREYSCNLVINWKFPKLARIKTSCISQEAEGRM